MTKAAAQENLDWRSRMLLTAGSGALRLLAATWRVTVKNEAEILRLRKSRQSFIFSLWHGQLLPLLWHHRDQGVAILVSEHKDGELIARVASGLGYRLVRGSSTRGGDRALINLVRELKEGREVAVTPDGPRGPAGSCAPGVLVAAQRSGAPILPIAAHTDSAWRLSSWDKFIIPKPFAKITIAYSAPVTISAKGAREAAGDATALVAAMRAAESSACG